MAYTKVTTESWGSRLGKAFGGIAGGLILIAVGTWLLYWNEGRTVKTSDSIIEAKAITVEMPDISKADFGLEGKLVHAYGKADTKDIVKDSMFGVEANAIAVSRKAEFYQWTEQSRSEKKKKLGGGEETVTVYTYKKGWTNSPVDSNSFEDPDYQGKNFVITEVENETAYAPLVTFGAYELPDFLKRSIGGEVSLAVNISSEDIKAMNKALAPSSTVKHTTEAQSVSADVVSVEYVHTSGNIIYLGEDPRSPQIGDVRVTFTKIPAADISIIAKVIGNTFEQFTASNGYKFSKLSMGKVSADEMFESAQSDNVIMAWILRIAGTIAIMSGLGMVFKPLSVLADVIPILGTIVGAGMGLVAFLLGLAWSLLVIAIAWIRFRPILAASLIAVGLVLVGFLYMKGKKNQAA